MNKYNFILNSFGLSVLKPKLYMPGQPPFFNAPAYPLQEDIPEEFESLSGEVAPTSMLGTPVFSNLTLETLQGDVSLTLDTVLMDVSQSKNIVKTTVQGRRGTVKEYISLGDYQITMRGVICNENLWKYPTADVDKLKFLLELDEALVVTSEYLQLWGIYNIVVDSYKAPQREGFQNSQLFEINASQDEPIELKID